MLNISRTQGTTTLFLGYNTKDTNSTRRLKSTMVYPLCLPASEYDKLVYF